LDFDLGITWHVDGIVTIELKRLAFGPHCRFAVEADQSDFVIVVVELYGWIACGERDAAVMEKTRSGGARRNRGAAAFAFVRLWYETRLRRDWVLSNFLVH
jgi:hypothetical protein